jgi:hypothetical protein
MDSEPLIFAGFTLLEQVLLTAMGALAVGVAFVLARSALSYRDNPTLGFWDAAALAVVSAGFAGFGLWIAFFAWFDASLSIREGVLRCGSSGNTYRLAAFADARQAKYDRYLRRAGTVRLARIVLIAPDGTQANCDTFLKPDDPTAAELLTAVRARLGR